MDGERESRESVPLVHLDEEILRKQNSYQTYDHKKVTERILARKKKKKKKKLWWPVRVKFYIFDLSKN